MYLYYAIVNRLYRTTPGAKALAYKSRGILIFPKVVKAGFIVAGQYGDGVLRESGRTVGYYRSVAASAGYQAGAESFGYVLFFMDEASLKYLDKSDGWELGTGPTLVVLKKRASRKIFLRQHCRQASTLMSSTRTD